MHPPCQTLIVMIARFLLMKRPETALLSFGNDDETLPLKLNRLREFVAIARFGVENAPVTPS